MADFHQNNFTVNFKYEAYKLKNSGIVKSFAELADRIGYSKSSLSDVFNGRRNIPVEIIANFCEEFKIPSNVVMPSEEDRRNQILEISEKLNKKLNKEEGIPMYEVDVSAGAVGMYNDFSEQRPIGYIQIPGFEDCDFSVPVWGHSMYPTFENGTWIICKEISNPSSIVPGECYYIEWEEYRMVKRLLEGDHDDEVLLYSDNDKEQIRSRPKYAPFSIKKSAIRRLYLIKGVHKKLSH